MSLLETIHSAEFQAAAESWQAEIVQQMDLRIELRARMLELDRQERDELASLAAEDLAMKFASLSRKDLARSVNQLPPAKRITKYWDWDRWLQKIW